MPQEHLPNPPAPPSASRVGYGDAAFIAMNAFSMHVVLGTSTHAGDVVPRVELTLSREFARHLAGALEHALAQTDVVQTTSTESDTGKSGGASTQPQASNMGL